MFIEGGILHFILQCLMNVVFCITVFTVGDIFHFAVFIECDILHITLFIEGGILYFTLQCLLNVVFFITVFIEHGILYFTLQC